MEINVQGGTNAGWRRVKQMVKKAWTCPGCGKRLEYFWNPCPNCGHPHPER